MPHGDHLKDFQDLASFLAALQKKEITVKLRGRGAGIAVLWYQRMEERLLPYTYQL